MFGFFKSKTSPAAKPASPATIRDTLFGDSPLTQWPLSSALDQDEPWASFVRARNHIGLDQRDQAIAIWRQITDLPGLESRHYAQAWYFLRIAGIQPPADRAKQVLGVVIEVGVHGGTDLLAAYPEKTARYINYSGAAVIWEHLDDSLDGLIDALLREGDRIVHAIGPWDQPRPPMPTQDQIRLNVLTPSGLHFGQGPFATFAKDPLAKPAIDLGVQLMQQLIAKRPK